MNTTYDPIPYRLDSLSRRYARLNNWLWACHDYREGIAPYPGGRRCPSKQVKHSAYDDLYALIHFSGITVPDEYRGTLHAMHYVLTALGKRPRPVAPTTPTRQVTA